MSIRSSKWAWKQKNISATEKIVLLCLSDYSDSLGENCYPSQIRVSEDTGLSRQTVNKSIAMLREKGLIATTVFKKYGKDLIHYRLNTLHGCQPGLQGVSSTATGGVKHGDTIRNRSSSSLTAEEEDIVSSKPETMECLPENPRKDKNSSSAIESQTPPQELRPAPPSSLPVRLSVLEPEVKPRKNSGYEPKVHPVMESLIKKFEDLQASRLGEPAIVLKGPARGGLRRLLKVFSGAEIFRRIGFWFQCEDAFIERRGYRIEDFISNFNVLKNGPIKKNRKEDKEDWEARYASQIGIGSIKSYPSQMQSTNGRIQQLA